MTTVQFVDRILEQLGELRARCPELRFGQLIATIGELARDETGYSLWDVEDGDFAAALERFAADMVRRDSRRAERAAAPDCGDMTSPPGVTAPQPPRQLS